MGGESKPPGKPTPGRHGWVRDERRDSDEPPKKAARAQRNTHTVLTELEKKFEEFKKARDRDAAPDDNTRKQRRTSGRGRRSTKSLPKADAPLRQTQRSLKAAGLRSGDIEGRYGRVSSPPAASQVAAEKEAIASEAAPQEDEAIEEAPSSLRQAHPEWDRAALVRSRPPASIREVQEPLRTQRRDWDKAALSRTSPPIKVRERDVRARTATKAATGPAAKPKVKGRLTILIVEPDAAHRDLLVQMLQADFDTEVAKDALVAAEILGAPEKPSLIVSEIVMPSVDGFSLVTTIRKRADLKDIPVIFVSGRASAKDVARAASLGVRQLVAKPYAAAELMAEIRRVLRPRA